VVLFADNWTTTLAEIIKKALENPGINQRTGYRFKQKKPKSGLVLSK
jgi:hypothetical protein